MSGLLNFAQSASNAVAGNVGGPVDLISAALRFAGMPIPDAPIGSTEWMRRKGFVRDVPDGAAKVLGETAGLLGPAMLTKFAPEIAGGLLQAGDNLAAPRTLPAEFGGVKAGASRPQYMADLVDALKSGEAKDVPFGRVTSRTEQQVNELREMLGEPLIQRGDQWVIPKNVVQKFIDKKIGPTVSPEKFVDDLNSAVHNTSNRVFQSKYPQNQGLLTTSGRQPQMAFVSVNPKTGEPVIKSGHPIKSKQLEKEVSEGRGLLSAGGARSTIVTTPESGATGVLLPGYAESKEIMDASRAPVYPRSEALETARQNAVKMLGLPENNTPMDRAKALGFVDDTYHGTFNRFDNFDVTKANPRSQYMPGIFTADNPALADNFGDYVMPLLQKRGTTIKDVVAARNAGLPKPVVDTIHDQAAGIRVTDNPLNIRSRFAAFDPARINENDLLGRADPRLLALLGLGAGGAAYYGADK